MSTVTFCNELNDNKIGYPSYVPRATHRFTFDFSNHNFAGERKSKLARSGISIAIKGTLSWLSLANCDVEIKNKALVFE